MAKIEPHGQQSQRCAWSIQRRNLMRVVRVLDAVLVSGYQGQYSVDHVSRLALHRRITSGIRLLLPVAITPLPALISIIATDWVPLSPPSDGLRAKSVIWLRTFVVACLMLTTLLLQLSVFVPRLRMQTRDIASVTVLTAISATACAYGLAKAVGFPIPFTITTTAPLTMTCFTVFSALWWGRLVIHDPNVRLQLVKYAVFTTAQFSITLVYPVLAYVFIRADSVALETFIACLLPLIKWLFRRLLSRALRNSSDTHWPLVIFSIDVFHAFFIACFLQNASSWITTATIVTMDVAFMLRTLRRLTLKLTAISAIFNDARTRDDKHPSPPRPLPDLLDSITFLLRDAHPTVVATIHVAATNTTRTLTQIVPSPPTVSPQGHSKQHPSTTEMALWSLDEADERLLSSLDPEQKAALTSNTLRLFDSMEYTALAEYIEVVVPAVYAVYLAVVYELPNRVYYPQLRSLTPAAHAHAINNVVVYVAFEVVSFVILEWVVRRKAKLSPLRQLSFVLSHHGWILPWELVLWISFVVQCTLEHYGNDYSFKFTWLHTNSSAIGD